MLAIVKSPQNINQLTLIIDGNWLFMTQIFICSKQLKRDSVDSYKVLKKYFFNVLLTTINNLNYCDNWILVSDNSSWRKKIEIPRMVIAEYKGQRKQDDSLNWSRIWETWEEIKQEIRAAGITVSDAEDIEGDDWIAYWVGYLKNKGISSLIWSKDQDLQQLVYYNPSSWCGWWNKDNGLVLHQDSSNIGYFSISHTSNLLNVVIFNMQVIKYIIPGNILIEKIINGDISDNIMPIIYHIHNNKRYRLPRKELPYNLDINNDHEVELFIRCKLAKEKYKDLTYEVVREHFEYNKRLVILQSKYYPENIKKCIVKNADTYKIAGKLKYSTQEISDDLFNYMDKL